MCLGEMVWDLSFRVMVGYLIKKAANVDVNKHVNIPISCLILPQFSFD